MKLSNFKFISTTGDRVADRIVRATVDVTTPPPFWLFWIKPLVETRHIAKDSLFWYFADTGEFTPGQQAENLFRAYEARHGKVIK